MLNWGVATGYPRDDSPVEEFGMLLVDWSVRGDEEGLGWARVQVEGGGLGVCGAVYNQVLQMLRNFVFQYFKT